MKGGITMRLRRWTTILVIVVAGALVGGAVPPFTPDVANAHAICDFVTGGGVFLLTPKSRTRAGEFWVGGGCKHRRLFGPPEHIRQGQLKGADESTRATPL